MYLILGNPQDACCLGVRTMLEARNYPVRVIANPLVHPTRFSWWLDNDRSASQLEWSDKTSVPNNQIAGVLVRSNGWLDPSGWKPQDLAYMQAETQAALLAWLWSLDCPVVNRYPSAIWYRAQVPILSWYPLLRRCGLPTLETLVTNAEQEARSFGMKGEQGEIMGVVYGPLSIPPRYLVASHEDWNGLAALQRFAPVSLTVPHGAAQFVCVVGGQVVWDEEPSLAMAALEPALRRFALATGLAFVELAFALTSRGICVIAVEPHPYLEHFVEMARQRILEGILQLLMVENDGGRKGSTHILRRSVL